MTYFDLFEQKPTFFIDKQALKQTLLTLQKRHHPDTAEESGVGSDLLNHAFDVLYCDDKRAIYLLELQGVPVNLDATTHDKAFLTQMMTLRIDLEEAKEAGDGTALADIKATLAQISGDTAEAFSETFAAQAWDEAKALALNLRFLARLSQAVAETHVYHDDNPDELYV